MFDNFSYRFVKILGIADFVDCPENVQTSAREYIPRYLAMAILFRRIDIAGHADSTGCNGNSNSNDNVTFVRRSSFGSNFAHALRREWSIDRVEQRRVILATDDVRNDL